MHPKVKRFLSAFGISFVVNFALYYLLVDDRACVLDWETECSKAFLFRAGLQTLFFTFLLYFLTRNKERYKNNEKLK